MEIENLDDYLYEIRVRRVEYKKHYPPSFWGAIAVPWFEDIGPRKAREYGFEAFLFLGPRAHIVDICGCHFRWRKLLADGHNLTSPSMLNALRDGFGYSVILSVMTGILPVWERLTGCTDAEEDISTLRNLYWDNINQPIDDVAVTLAHAVPLLEFQDV